MKISMVNGIEKLSVPNGLNASLAVEHRDITMAIMKA